MKAAASDPYLAMMRGALVPTLAVGLVAVAVSAVLGGRPLVGSALGAGVVVGFFGLTLLVMRAARDQTPEMQLGVAMALYSTKVVVVGGLVFALRGQPWLSPTAFAVTVVACVLAWQVGQVLGFARARVLVADPEPVDR